MSEVRLQVKNLCKSFGITKAVQNVSFNVNKGEVHALIGENGSGKSTLTNMLTGIYSIDSGTFVLDGKEIHPKNQVEANEEGVSIIVQELGTLSGLTVAENIFLGHEDQFVHCGIKNTNAMNKKANELLKQYGFDRIKASDMIDNYNFEDRKLVEIVKATYFDPKIVVIDDEISKDKMRKNILKFAAPDDIKISILSAERAVEVWNKNKFGNFNVFVLFRDVNMIRKCKDLGLVFPDISLGQMSIIDDRKQIYRQLGLSEAEAQTLLDLEKEGLNIYFQMIPTDKKESLEMIKKVFPNVA